MGRFGDSVAVLSPGGFDFQRGRCEIDFRLVERSGLFLFARHDERGEECGLGGGESAVDGDAVVSLFLILNMAEGVELGDDVVARMRDE